MIYSVISIEAIHHTNEVQVHFPSKEIINLAQATKLLDYCIKSKTWKLCSYFHHDISVYHKIQSNCCVLAFKSPTILVRVRWVYLS